MEKDAIDRFHDLSEIFGWLSRLTGKDCTGFADATMQMGEIESRLMPEGMEWPVFEDGAPVRIGDEYVDTFGANTVATIEFGDGYSAINPNTPGGYVVGKFEGAHGRYVPRPAPKVLDADGMEICKGDTVYQMGCKYRVSHLHGANDYVRIVYENSGRWVDPKTLTHRAPVLAADGRPLREGETVWSTDSGTRYTVEKVTDELIPIKCCSEMGSTVSLHPSQLTHERPVADTWERLEEDADATARLFDAFDADASADIRDIVRRAKKLAEG